MMALAVKWACGAKFLFDMRGFWANERVDGGLWPEDGKLYRVTKRLERTFLLAADHVVTLTHASAQELKTFPYLRGRTPPITVIPTCADLDRFSRDPVQTPDSGFVFGYVGSVGTWYLFDEVIRFFQALRVHAPEARMLVVNRNEHAYLEEAFRRADIPPSAFQIVAAEHRDVPALVRRMTVAAAIIKPSYSKMASAPTKLAEYLGCGVPCVGNTNVGDMEATLDGESVGVVLTDFSPDDHAAGAQRLMALLADPGLAERCARTAARLFSLDVGVAAYREIYRSLVAPASSRRAS
jgi:glycosyltransferase involved in cell wall biosynthesis